MGETDIANAEAGKIAAQILAEMLGLVCHRDYFEIGEQMVQSLVSQFLRRSL